MTVRRIITLIALLFTAGWLLAFWSGVGLLVSRRQYSDETKSLLECRYVHATGITATFKNFPNHRQLEDFYCPRSILLRGQSL